MSDHQVAPSMLPDVVNRLIGEAATYRSPLHYLAKANNHYFNTGYQRFLCMLADASQMTCIMEAGDDLRAYGAFYKGIVLGSRLVEVSLADSFGLQDVVNNINQVNYVDGEVDDEQARRYGYATSIRRIGQLGLASQDPNLRLLDEWEADICSAEINRPFLKGGFGFMLQAGRRLIQADSEQPSTDHTELDP